MNNNITTLNQLGNEWTNSKHLLSSGMDYLKKSHVNIKKYHDLWVNANSNGENSEAARKALYNYATVTYRGCKELQKLTKQQLDSYQNASFSIKKVSTLWEIHDACSIARQCYKNIINNPSVNGLKPKLLLANRFATTFSVFGCVSPALRLLRDGIFGHPNVSNEASPSLVPLFTMSLICLALLYKNPINERFESGNARMRRNLEFLDGYLLR